VFAQLFVFAGRRPRRLGFGNMFSVSFGTRGPLFTSGATILLDTHNDDAITISTGVGCIARFWGYHFLLLVCAGEKRAKFYTSILNTGHWLGHFVSSVRMFLQRHLCNSFARFNLYPALVDLTHECCGGWCNMLASFSNGITRLDPIGLVPGWRGT